MSQTDAENLQRHLVEMLRDHALRECADEILESVPRWTDCGRNTELPRLRESWMTMTPEQKRAVAGFMRLAAFDTLYTVISVIGGTGDYDPLLDWWGFFRLEYCSEDGRSSLMVSDDEGPMMMDVLMEETPFAR